MSWFLVMAACSQFVGDPVTECSPFQTFRRNEFTDKQTCLVVADDRHRKMEQALKAKAKSLGRELAKLDIYSECNTVAETIELLELNSKQSEG